MQWVRYLEKFCNLVRYGGHIVGRFKTLNHIAGTVDEKLGEIPLDRRVLCIVWILLGQDFQENRGNLVVHIKALETLLALQEGIEGTLPLPIDFNLGKARELGPELGSANLVNLIN